jgi:hypothetical protein
MTQSSALGMASETDCYVDTHNAEHCKRHKRASDCDVAHARTQCRSPGCARQVRLPLFEIRTTRFLRMRCMTHTNYTHENNYAHLAYTCMRQRACAHRASLGTPKSRASPRPESSALSTSCRTRSTWCRESARTCVSAPCHVAVRMHDRGCV